MAVDATDFTIIGAGLSGALLATLLAQRGHRVDVYERRADPRLHGYAGGRSINMALAERGLHALRQADADAEVRRQAVMMRGRMIHPLHDEPHLQPYGQDDSEVNWSISRGEMNIALIDTAEAAGATLHFDHALHAVDFDRRTFTTSGEGGSRQHGFRYLLGTDGAGSTLRQQMALRRDLGERIEGLGHSYKELEIPPSLQGDFRMEPNALHIWPRGRYMCIALPNDEKTFTVTLFLPNEGDPSFATIRDGREARALFERDFADALPLMPTLEEDFDRNPIGSLATLYLQHWHLDGLAVLVGDAAHAMVPFHGQGMNCALEDCVALAEALDAHADTATAFAAYQQARAANALAIQTMALENYLEMRDHVDDADYQLQRQLELLLEKRHPGRFVPRYSMVTFMRIPYALAFERGRIQRALLVEATQGRTTLDDIDWTWLDAEVKKRLSPLEE